MPHDYAPHPSAEPRQLDARSDADVFETITRAVFNAGLSWKVVDKHWPALCDAFADFDPERVAMFGEADIQRVLGREDVIQSKNKVRGTVKNAEAYVQLAEERGDVLAWLRSLDSYEAREEARHTRFEWLGELGAYWTLYTLKVPVPDYRAWCEERGRPVPPALQG